MNYKAIFTPKQKYFKNMAEQMFSPGAFDPSIIKEGEQIEIQPGHYTQDSGQFDVVHTEWENNEYNL
jgi:hypothetical protein